MNTFLVMVKSGFISTTPIVIKPMVSLFADSVFAPYAMTNRELTELNTTIDRSSNIKAILGSLTQANNHAFQYGKMLNFCVRLSGVTCYAYDNIAKIENCKFSGTDTFVFGKIVGGEIINFQLGISGNDTVIKSGVNLQNAEVMVYNTTISIV